MHVEKHAEDSVFLNGKTVLIGRGFGLQAGEAGKLRGVRVAYA